MKLIILLVVLGLERYLGVGSKIKRFCWFDSYLKRVNDVLGKQPWFNGFVGAILTLLPIPVVITLVVCLLSSIFGGMKALIWLVLNIAVLFYCLGPFDLYRQAYVKADSQEKNNLGTTNEAEKQILDGSSMAEPHAMTKAIFWQSNQSLYGPLFWFMLFGIFGSLFYRCAVLLRQATSRENSLLANQHIAAQQIQNILDWVPVRILTLYFALVGQFSACFTYWLENIISGLSDCRRFISEGGWIALGSVKTDKGLQHTEEYRAALSLIDRALIIFLAIVAMFTLGSWVY